MKCFKVFLIALICLSTAGVLHAAERIAVFYDGFIFSDPAINLAKVNIFNAASLYKKYEAARKRYIKILEKAAEESKSIEIKGLEFDNSKLLNVNSKGDKGGYRPFIRRNMTNERAFTVDNVIEQYREAHVLDARKAKCSYIIEGSFVFEGSEVICHFILENLNTQESLPVTGRSIIKQESKAKASKTKSFKTSSSKNKDKSKNKKDEKFEIQNAKEQAAYEAFAQAVESIREYLTGDFLAIAEIKDSNIILNKGSSSYVRKGDYYLVQTDASDGMNDVFGESNSKNMINLAIIKIIDVNESSSIAEILPETGNINNLRKGDTMRLVSKMQTDEFLSRAKSGEGTFAAKRPEIKTAAKNNNQEQKVEKLEPLPALKPGVIRVGVMNFDSKTDGVSQAEAATLTDLFMRMLANSEKIAVLERARLDAVAREQKLNLSGFIDTGSAAKIGKLAGCKYILLGSVTNIEERDTVSGYYIKPRRAPISQNDAAIQLLGALISAAAGERDRDNTVTETHELITYVDARLIDVETSEIISAYSEIGSAAESDIITQDKDGNVKHVESNHGDLQAKAIASAASVLSHKIREALTGEKIQIASVNDSEIIINRGSASGVQADDLFCVYDEGQSQNNGDTEAIIKVTEVQDAFSTAVLAKSINNYDPKAGGRLDPVLNSDFQHGIWHIKNQRRAEAEEKDKQNASLEDLAKSMSIKKRFETSSTETKKVIKSYGLKLSQEKSLINAHAKAAKESSARKKYESYKKLSEFDKDLIDFLAAYQTGKYALELSMYVEAREWASKALYINPKYKPAIELINKIDKN